MQTLPTLRILLLGLTLAATSCSHYSSVSENRPSHRSPTAAGQMITEALKFSAKDSRSKIGRYLDATAAAGNVLAKNPGDTQAQSDYNFAVARIFETIQDAGLEPWNAPLPCPGANQTWNLSFTKPKSLNNFSLSDFSIRPADRFQFKGKLVVQQNDKPGLGAPLVINTKEIDITQIDPFAQGKHAYYGVTGLIDINGHNCTATLLDPLSVETAKMGSQTYPLAADFTAPIALALAELNPRKKELGAMFKPDKAATTGRLARLQPYDPKKIPILCIHGLGDSQATWAPMIESLRADPVIRTHYQIWFFSYPSGNPYPASAAVLREQMDAIKKRHPGHKKIVVIGHSMGGMISRTLMTDSGMTLWNAVYDKPPAEMPFTPETRKVMTGALIFNHRPDIARVIFCSPSHRGADMATNFFGRMGSKIIGAPKKLLGGDSTALDLAKPDPSGAQKRRMPNSIDFLDPKNRFVNNLAALPLAKGIPYHSILGDRGKGGNLDRTPPVSSDGIVPYWSSHLDGAQSELIIPSGHWTNQHPQGIAEVKRILHLHLGRK